MVLCLCLVVPIHSFGDCRLRVVAVTSDQRHKQLVCGLLLLYTKSWKVHCSHWLCHAVYFNIWCFSHYFRLSWSLLLLHFLLHPTFKPVSTIWERLDVWLVWKDCSAKLHLNDSEDIWNNVLCVEMFNNKSQHYIWSKQKRISTPWYIGNINMWNN